ncbi:MAG: hypothetical protein ACYCXF_01920 [Thermoleophilia bacterium]
MEYLDLINTLHHEAESVLAAQDSWTAEQVAGRLSQIADALMRIRNQHESGIDASMGKRSGRASEV